MRGSKLPRAAGSGVLGDPAADTPLDAILEVEQELDRQVGRHRTEAVSKVRLARAAAEHREAHRRREIAADGSRLLERGKRRIDQQLARKEKQREEDLKEVASSLKELREALCNRILAKVLGK